MSSSQAAELQAAIQLGNIEQSQLIARQLAEARAKLVVRLDEDDKSAESDMIRSDVYLSCQLSSC